MKKISKLGLPLSKEELKAISGGEDFSGCSVTCSSGYYACCNPGPTCVCRVGPDVCMAGGPGASSCSWNS